MAISRKRKLAATKEKPAGKQLGAGKTQKGIKDFATVSKLHGDDGSIKKKRKTMDREATPPTVAIVKPNSAEAKSGRSAETDKKRKRGASPTADDDSEPEKESAASFFKHFTQPKQSSVRNKRVKNEPPSPLGTPSKATVALFDKLNLRAQPIPFALGQKKSGYETPPDTPEEVDAGLLNELQNLIELHTSFLASLSVYYAHNGTSSPAEVNDILSLVTKNWKRRAVTLEDLRRLLALDQQQGDDFTLQDYGRGGICLTRSQLRGRALKRAASYIDEQELSRHFEWKLHQRWSEWQASKSSQDKSAAAFIAQLPLVEIERNASVDKAAPLLMRGRQRLADLKADQAAAQSSVATSSPTTVTSEQKSVQAVQNRGTSLLDRILAKQAHTAAMPAGPTRDQLERKAALYRVEEVARVLELLAGMKMRASFSIQILTQHLQQSMRNPISREEVERCLGLMAQEITPGFVNVIQSGTVKGVVICKAQKLAVEDLRMQVQRAEA